MTRSLCSKHFSALPLCGSLGKFYVSLLRMLLYFGELVWTSLTGFSFCCYYRQLLSNVEVLSLGPLWWPFISSWFLPPTPSDQSHFLKPLVNECEADSTLVNLSGFAAIHPPVDQSLFNHPGGHVDSVAQPPKKCCSSLDLAKCSFFLETLWFELMPFFFLVLNMPDSRIFLLLPTQPEDSMSCP